MRKFKWTNVALESASYTTEELKQFYKDVKNYIKKQLQDTDCELIEFTKGHFFVSGYIQNQKTKKIVYFSMEDLRDYGWSNKCLYRTAESVNDTFGGMNNFAEVNNLFQRIVALSNRE